MPDKQRIAALERELADLKRTLAHERALWAREARQLEQAVTHLWRVLVPTEGIDKGARAQ